MPYIITTKRSDEAREADARRLEATGHTGEAFQLRHSDAALSRRAVATLEEARKVATAAVPREATNTLWERALMLPEAGGTVGPLPDGTVIEVAERSYHLLRAMANLATGMTDAEIIDAYNAVAS